MSMFSFRVYLRVDFPAIGVCADKRDSRASKLRSKQKVSGQGAVRRSKQGVRFEQGNRMLDAFDNNAENDAYKVYYSNIKKKKKTMDKCSPSNV